MRATGFKEVPFAHRFFDFAVRTCARSPNFFIGGAGFCILSTLGSIFFDHEPGCDLLSHRRSLDTHLALAFHRHSFNNFKVFSGNFAFFLIRRLRSALIPLLDCMILGLQTGKSFRASFLSAVESQSGWVRVQMFEVLHSLQFPESNIAVKSALLADFLSEMRTIDQSQTRCVEQVKALRRHYKMLEDFRRRSGQVSQQIKMQAIIVTALYLALFVFVIMQFGFEKHRNLLFGSGLVFIAGLVFIFYVGRRMKWTV
ncbi:hypothetical protein [Bdellovibrio bacteriovorus]|uniref:hypothetical protein n=1 Tax=Bdellovibrio bacteriovorus TaxID=959 RepID=UPI0035A70E6E